MAKWNLVEREKRMEREMRKKEKSQKKSKRNIGCSIVMYFMLIGIFIGIGAAVAIIMGIVTDAPTIDLSDYTITNISTVFYDKDGKEIDGETSDTYQPTAFGSYYCKLYASKDDQTSQPVNSKTIVISESRITATVSVNTTKAYTNIPLEVTVTYNVEAADAKYQWVKPDNNSGDDVIV